MAAAVVVTLANLRDSPTKDPNKNETAASGLQVALGPELPIEAGEASAMVLLFFLNTD